VLARQELDREEFDRVRAAIHPSADWLETSEQMLQQLRALPRARSDGFANMTRLTGLCAIAGVGKVHFGALSLQLKQACGLSDFEQMDPALDHGTRLRFALEGAQARFVGSTEHERFADPLTAIRELATRQCSIKRSAVCAASP
jgi:hypothetical protein